MRFNSHYTWNCHVFNNKGLYMAETNIANYLVGTKRYTDDAIPSCELQVAFESIVALNTLNQPLIVPVHDRFASFTDVR